jgi:hypothetical protein
MAIKRNPYPILESDYGDFEHHKFDATLLDAEVKDGVFSFHFKTDFDEPILTDLLKQKKVKFVVKVESKPFFSKTFSSDLLNPNEVFIKFNYVEVPATFTFEFSPMLLAVDSFAYKNENAEEPLKDYSFNIQPNQTLARSKMNLSFEIGYKEHNSGALIKIKQLKDGKIPNCGAFDINLTDPRNILVYLEQENFKKLMSLNAGHQKVLDTLITIPVLQYAISDYLKNPSDYEEGSKDWFDELDNNYRLREEVNEMPDVLTKCNEILHNPLIPFVEFFRKKYLEE